MAQLIDKNDFGDYVKWSANIPDRDVDPHCKDAQNFDAFPIMPLAVVSGNNMITDIETALAESPVTKPELVAFYNTYLEPFLVCKAYARFLLWHGRNIAQYGFVTNQEDTSIEVSDKTRGEMIADIQSKSNIYWARLTANLKDTSFTYDGIVYSFECTTKNKPKTRIRAI